MSLRGRVFAAPRALGPEASPAALTHLRPHPPSGGDAYTQCAPLSSCSGGFPFITVNCPPHPDAVDSRRAALVRVPSLRLAVVSHASDTPSHARVARPPCLYVTSVTQGRKHVNQLGDSNNVT